MEKVMYRQHQNVIIHIMIFSYAFVYRVCDSLFTHHITTNI